MKPGCGLGAAAGRWAALVLAVGVSLGAGPRAAGRGAPAPARAEPPPGGMTLPELLRQAERHYRSGAWVDAERLYREGLSRPGGSHLNHCLDRLLEIYARLGRADRAVQVGLVYHRLLRGSEAGATPPGGVRRRLRALDLELGEGFLGLGHYRTAEGSVEPA